MKNAKKFRNLMWFLIFFTLACGQSKAPLQITRMAPSSDESTGSRFGQIPNSIPSIKIPPFHSPELPSVAQQVSSPEIKEAGVILPTIYYTPIFKDSARKCSKTSMQDLVDKNAKNLISVCPNVAKSCDLQGTCFIEEDGKMRRFSVVTKLDGVSRYEEMGPNDCQYGFGVKSICLDPFYSVAADLLLYQPGDVLFIPEIKGLILPDGSAHNGYFIIRDQGRAIKGKGRFDFFTGFYDLSSQENSFLKIKLSDQSTRFTYALIIGDRADQVRKIRNYPH